jgi:hypothetical protein
VVEASKGGLGEKFGESLVRLRVRRGKAFVARLHFEQLLDCIYLRMVVNDFVMACAKYDQVIESVSVFVALRAVIPCEGRFCGFDMTDYPKYRAA